MPFPSLNLHFRSISCKTTKVIEEQPLQIRKTHEITVTKESKKPTPPNQPPKFREVPSRPVGQSPLNSSMRVTNKGSPSPFTAKGDHHPSPSRTAPIKRVAEGDGKNTALESSVPGAYTLVGMRSLPARSFSLTRAQPRQSGTAKKGKEPVPIPLDVRQVLREQYPWETEPPPWGDIQPVQSNYVAIPTNRERYESRPLPPVPSHHARSQPRGAGTGKTTRQAQSIPLDMRNAPANGFHQYAPWEAAGSLEKINEAAPQPGKMVIPIAQKRHQATFLPPLPVVGPPVKPRGAGSGRKTRPPKPIPADIRNAAPNGFHQCAPWESTSPPWETATANRRVRNRGSVPTGNKRSKVQKAQMDDAEKENKNDASGSGGESEDSTSRKGSKGSKTPSEDTSLTIPSRGSPKLHGDSDSPTTEVDPAEQLGGTSQEAGYRTASNVKAEKLQKNASKGVRAKVKVRVRGLKDLFLFKRADHGPDTVDKEACSCVLCPGHPSSEVLNGLDGGGLVTYEEDVDECMDLMPPPIPIQSASVKAYIEALQEFEAVQEEDATADKARLPKADQTNDAEHRWKDLFIINKSLEDVIDQMIQVQVKQVEEKNNLLATIAERDETVSALAQWQDTLETSVDPEILKKPELQFTHPRVPAMKGEVPFTKKEYAKLHSLTKVHGLDPTPEPEKSRSELPSHTYVEKCGDLEKKENKKKTSAGPFSVPQRKSSLAASRIPRSPTSTVALKHIAPTASTTNFEPIPQGLSPPERRMPADAEIQQLQLEQIPPPPNPFVANDMYAGGYSPENEDGVSVKDFAFVDRLPPNLSNMEVVVALPRVEPVAPKKEGFWAKMARGVGGRRLVEQWEKSGVACS